MRSLQTMAASISMGGIGVYSDDPVEIETDVSLSIHFISAEGLMETATAEGHVVYDKTIGAMHFIGIQFDEDLSPEGQPSLHAHLQKILAWSQ